MTWPTRETVPKGIRPWRIGPPLSPYCPSLPLTERRRLPHSLFVIWALGPFRPTVHGFGSSVTSFLPPNSSTRSVFGSAPWTSPSPADSLLLRRPDVGRLRARVEASFGGRYDEEDDDDDDLDDLWRRSSSAVSPLPLPETSFGSESVPEGQRPVNEYLDMLRSPLFDWALSDGRLRTRLAVVYGVFFFAVCWPIAGATFTSEGYLLQKVVTSHVGAAGVVLALLVRLYTGWSYVGDRLRSQTIEYEETGWFDGDVERKTVSEQKRDKFLYQSEVRPVVDRLKALTLGGCAVFVASVVTCNVALTAHPVFDQYDPEMLEQLRYDEKLADKAASESSGRPTYCDSRYYRAVAGGAPGCN